MFFGDMGVLVTRKLQRLGALNDSRIPDSNLHSYSCLFDTSIYCGEGIMTERKNFLVEVFKDNKAILLITAFTIGVYATMFGLLQARVNNNECRIQVIEEKCTDIGIIKNDVAWIKQILERKLK